MLLESDQTVSRGEVLARLGRQREAFLSNSLAVSYSFFAHLV